MQDMRRSAGKAHVVRVNRSHVDKQGQRRDYESVLLRRSFRDGRKVRNETLANLSKLPAEAIAAVEATLKGQTLVPGRVGMHPLATARACGGGGRDGAHPGAGGAGGPAVPVPRSGGGADHLSGHPPEVEAVHAGVVGRFHLGVDLDVAGACTDEIYAAMDWLAERQEAIETKLAAKHLGPERIRRGWRCSI